MANAAQAAKAMRDFAKALPVAVVRGLRKGMPIAEKLAKTKYMVRKSNRHPRKAFDPPNPPPGPLGIRSGNLVRTVHVGELRYTGKKVIASLVAGNEQIRYAKVHENGMTIYPRNGLYLIFPAGLPGGGYRMVRATRVVIKPRPFLRPALDEATPQIVAIVSREVLTVARVALKGIARF
jgi:hypothetical protein